MADGATSTMRARWLAHLHSRRELAAAAVALALGARIAAPSPPPKTVEGVASMLGLAAGAPVGPDDFVWEERGGFLHDALIGRRVLFLAARDGGGNGAKPAPRDLYRARIRLTRSGRPIGVAAVRNLTDTPLGDEGDLTASGDHVAFSTSAFGAVQAVTLLDLRGEGDGRVARSLPERFATSIDSWLETDSARGIRRAEIAFATPPATVRMELTAESLVLAFGDEGLPAALEYDDYALNTGGNAAFGARVQRVVHHPPPVSDVALRLVDLAVGATLTRAVRFGAERARATMIAVARLVAPPKVAVATPGRPVAPNDPASGWPPRPLARLVEPAREGEGEWRTVELPFWAARDRADDSADPVASTAAPPPAFAQTAIRPDPSRPRAVVHLVAMDTRQLDLALTSGVALPHPAVGPHGTGVLPPRIAPERVVAVFDAGPPTPPPEVLAQPFGLVASNRVLVPPAAGAASIVLRRDGAIGFGSFPSTGAPPAWSGLEPFDSLLQAPPLIVGGVRLAPVPFEGADDSIDRAAIGATRTGHLVYAWAANATADTLAKALDLADCDRGVLLARGPMPSGLSYVHFGAAPADLAMQLAAPAMTLSRAQLEAPSPQPLFFAVRRDPAPAAAGLAWVVDPGKQPAPDWLPAIHSAIATTLGAQVHVASFAPDRFAWRLRAGSRELSHRGGSTFASRLEDDELARAIAAIGVGAGRRKAARGLATAGSTGRPFRPDAGVLVATASGIAIVPSNAFALPPGADATELPLTADEGKLRPEAREVGSMRVRAAACTLPDRTFVVASTTFDSDEAVTQTLLDLGCSRVVALDRGGHQPAFVHRAGTETPPEARYETSALYAVEVPMRGRVRDP